MLGQGGRESRREAARAMERGDILTRLQLGLWLYLDDPQQTLAVIDALADRKKYLDLELIFASEGARFRDSDEFARFTAEHGLDEFWRSWRGPDN